VVNQILEVLAGNAVAASVLFLIALGITCCTRTPALRNLAWTLVLLKLVTPGIVSVPLPSLFQHQAIEPASVAPFDAEPIIRSREASPARVAGARRAADQPRALTPQPAGALRGFGRWTPAAFALGVLLTGSVVIVLLSFTRIVRLRGLLSRAASLSQDVGAEVRRVKVLARLKSEPRVLVIDARVTPFILPFGWRPVLVLPQPLLRTLDEEERATLIAHELAHLRRRDHWLAWIELAAVALYWWLPVAWLARNFARRSSENCCDGWVLRWLPDSSVSYAGALLKVVDFIAPRPIALLDFAPAMGRFSLTKWRVAMILENKCRPQMPRPARLVAWPLCAVLLACTPALVRKVQSDDGIARPATSERPAPAASAAIALAAAQAEGQPLKVRPSFHKLVVHLVDSDNQAVSGADVGTHAFWGQAKFENPSAQAASAGGMTYLDHCVSDKNGIAQIENQFRELGDWRGHIAVIVRHAERHLIALADVDSAHLTEPIELKLVPECEMSGKVVCPDLAKLGRKVGWSNVMLSIGRTVTMECYSEKEGDFHFFVPPGRYNLFAYDGTYLAGNTQAVTVPSGPPEMEVSLTLAAAKWALLMGRPAPELRGIGAWKNSGPLKLADLRGKCVLLYFFESHLWLARDMQALLDLFDRFSKDGLVVIAVHKNSPELRIDSAEQLDSRLADFRKQWGGREIPFPIAFATGDAPAVLEEYGIQSSSTALLIDRRGNLVDKVRLRDSAKAAASLQKCLNERPAAGSTGDGRR
jgi:beta-lactamase regulating signal transducer with metallopeptidase domain/peroxiredoxin